MGYIKSGRYTDTPKGYLTYPIVNTPGRSEERLQNILLIESPETRYVVECGDQIINEKRITKPLQEALEGVGAKITRIRRNHTEGRKKLLITVDSGDVIELPVEIRKKTRGSVLESIQIRVTGETVEELLKNIDSIKKYLSVWNINPTVCVWSQGGWKDAIPTDERKPVVDEVSNMKERERLKNIIADLKDEIQTLRAPLLTKQITEERKVMYGILK